MEGEGKLCVKFVLFTETPCHHVRRHYVVHYAVTIDTVVTKEINFQDIQ